MQFLFWHYTQGLNQYLKRWYFLLAWIVHYFSITVLIPSLFAPWKRLIDNEVAPGFSFERWFQQVTFNLISRFIGAIVRIILLITSILVLIPAFVVGFIGLFFWVAFPLIGIPYYLAADKHHLRLFNQIQSELSKTDIANNINIVFDSLPGKFVLSKVGIDIKNLLQITSPKAELDIPESPLTDYYSFIKLFTKDNIWPETKLKKLGIEYKDFEYSAYWWDEVYHTHPEEGEDKLRFSKPGLGLELLFGYTPQLNKYSTDLSTPQNFSHHLIGREKLVSQLQTVLSSGQSLVLYGEPGVGKRTILLELAKKASVGELGSSMIYKRFMELDYNFLLSQNLDINQKKTHLSQILNECSASGNVVLVINDLHRLVHPDVEGLDFTDLFENHLSQRKLKIIAISSRIDYERFLAQNSRLRKFLQPVEATPVDYHSALLILLDYLYEQEKNYKITLNIQSVRRILDGSNDYITNTPFPEKVLELADQVITYSLQKHLKIISAEIVDSVLSDFTGISISKLTSNQKDILLNLENLLHTKLIGQDNAINSIAKSLRSRDLGVKNSARPVGSFLFLGPTGVGKTETAKILAEVYFGSIDSILRFDMAEFAGDDGFKKLVGDAKSNQPGLLSVAIKKHPSSLLLLDEIEKAPKDIFNLFLSILDEGEFTAIDGKKVSCKHLFIIATSNACAEFIRQSVNSKISGIDLQTSVLEEIQKQSFFSPEFINRFDGVVVYEPLTQKELVQIARLQLQNLSDRLNTKNIILEITPEACEKVAELGFNSQYGARPMRRLIDLEIGDIIAKSLLNTQIKSGDKIRLDPITELPYFSLYVYPS